MLHLKVPKYYNEVPETRHAAQFACYLIVYKHFRGRYQPELDPNIQPVPRSKHTPSRL